MDLQDAAVCAFVEFAGRIKGALDAPALSAVRPSPFAAEGCGFQDALVDVEELLAQMEGDVKKYLRLSRATEAAAARAGAMMQPTMPTGSRTGSSDTSVGPSVSQVGSMVGSLAVAPLTAAALAALQTQTRLPSEFSAQPPPQGGGGRLQRGALAHTLQYDSGGVWVNTVHGQRWCSAKGPRPLDLEGVCPAGLLPNSLERDAYCTGGAACSHYLPKSFMRVHSTKVLPPASLIMKNPNGKGGGARSDGGGRNGGGAEKRNGGKEAAKAPPEKEAGEKSKKYRKKKASKDNGDD